MEFQVEAPCSHTLDDGLPELFPMECIDMGDLICSDDEEVVIRAKTETAQAIPIDHSSSFMTDETGFQDADIFSTLPFEYDSPQTYLGQGTSAYDYDTVSVGDAIVSDQIDYDTTLLFSKDDPFAAFPILQGGSSIDQSTAASSPATTEEIQTCQISRSDIEALLSEALTYSYTENEFRCRLWQIEIMLWFALQRDAIYSPYYEALYSFISLYTTSSDKSRWRTFKSDLEALTQESDFTQRLNQRTSATKTAEKMDEIDLFISISGLMILPLTPGTPFKHVTLRMLPYLEDMVGLSTLEDEEIKVDRIQKFQSDLHAYCSRLKLMSIKEKQKNLAAVICEMGRAFDILEDSLDEVNDTILFQLVLQKLFFMIVIYITRESLDFHPSPVNDSSNIPFKYLVFLFLSLTVQ